MKNLTELQKERENKLTDAIKSNRVFFAFSNKQFDEGKTHLDEGDKYTRLWGGTYLPKSLATSFLQTLELNNEWFVNALEENNLRGEYILYELYNHEAFYTGEIEDTFNSLPQVNGREFTIEEVLYVYRHKKSKQA